MAIAALLLLLPIRLFEIANPDWRVLAWIHAAAVVTLTLLYLLHLGGWPWLRHFAFPVAFIFVAIPWVTPIERPIIQGLMRLVAGFAAETVTLFGIPAQVEGNLIRVTTGLVGVNEACSGVRSLQTSLMIGLLLGELKRLATPRRVVLVICAVAIALAANFLRALFLVWLVAIKGISELGHWHDFAGYAILILVFACTLGVAYLLGSRGLSKTVVAGVSPADSKNLQPGRLPLQTLSWPPVFYLAAALCWLVLAEAGASAWYRAHESNLVKSAQWRVQWPRSAANFHELQIDEPVRSILRFDHGRAASWTWPVANAAAAITYSSDLKTIMCLLYFFRWEPGENSALLANLHRPDVCLPASGWVQVADTGVRNYRVNNSLALPFRHFEFRHPTTNMVGDAAHQTAHVFYCLWEDRTANPSGFHQDSKPPLMFGDPARWTRSERLQLVLAGRRHLGQQTMEFIAVTPESVDAREIDALFAQALPQLVNAGANY